MQESFLQFVWQQQLFRKENLQTVKGETIEIINQGQTNTDAGPDFYNSKIKVGQQTWAGTVEIHLKSSDWFKHHHDRDKSYENVILHVVAEYDAEIKRQSGEEVPTFVLEIDNQLYDNYMKLVTNKGAIPCADFLSEIDEFYIKHWQSRLIVDRLKRKSDEVLQKLSKNENSWEETFFQLLAKNFGFKQNALPFEMLAKSLSMKSISKQKDNLLQIEAMLFGQAGFLDSNCEDEYYLILKREYEFLKKKYKLKTQTKHLWKFLRMRPVNFPTIRIAQFAAVLFKNSNLFSKIIETNDVEQIKKIFDVETSEYWQTHYNFCKESKKKNKKFGEQSKDIILINSIVLFLFAYGDKNNLEDYKSKALELLNSIKKEKNNIIEKWNRVGVKTQNAFESQAQIELFNEYCKKGKCLKCNIGAKIIVKEVF